MVRGKKFKRAQKQNGELESPTGCWDDIIKIVIRMRFESESMQFNSYEIKGKIEDL